MKNSYSEKSNFISGFSKFYNKEILSDIYELEEKRKKYYRKLNYMYCIVFFSVFLFLVAVIKAFSAPKYYQFSFGEIVFIAIGFILVPLVIRYMYIFDYEIKNFQNIVKNKVLFKILSYVGEFKEYDKNKIDMTYFFKLLEYSGNMLPSSINLPMLGSKEDEDDDFDIKDYIDDCICGRYKDVNIEIIEMLKLGASNITTLLLKFPCNKNFKGRTVISRMPLINRFYGLQNVKLEKSEFSSLYHVYSTDQQEARYLITLAFMARLVHLSWERIGQYFVLVFEDGQVGVSLTSYTNKDWFDVDISRDLTSARSFENIAYQLYLICSIIDTLKFDRNIGM